VASPSGLGIVMDRKQVHRGRRMLHDKVAGMVRESFSILVIVRL